MKKIALLAFAAASVAVVAYAHGLSTQGTQTLSQMFTQTGGIGFPPFAADPYTCDSTSSIRTTYYNTASNVIFFCNGTAWTQLTTGAGATPGGATTQVQFNLAGAFSGDADLTFVTDTLTGTIINGSTRVGAGLLDAANAVWLSSNAITSEGSSADANELVLAFGNHTADQTYTITASASTVTWASAPTTITVFSTSDAASTSVVDSRSTAAGGLGVIRATNDQGANVAANLIAYGSTNGATVFGVSTNNMAGFFGNGSSLAAMVFGTQTADPAIFGANDQTRYYIAPSAKALTAGVATAFVQIDVASGTTTGGTIIYSIRADDATDFQSRSGELVYSVVNKAGTETCTLARPDGGATVDDTTDALAQSSASTLTNTFTCTTTPANGVLVLANAASGLTETTLNISYSVFKNVGAGAVTPQ